MNLRVYEGFPVFHMLQTTEVREGWLRLQARCPWASFTTHPDFVEAWLRFSELRPVLAIAFDQGWVTGVLPMATDGAELIMCGGRDVPVHGWLAEPLRGSEVLETHLALLTKNRKRTEMVLTPGAPTDWLSARRPIGRRATPELLTRRRVRLDAARAERPLDKKKNTSQLPRLKALGELSLWEGSDLPTYVRWHEQKRHHRGRPASSRPSRLGLYRRLGPEQLYCTELRAGEEVLSSMLIYRQGAHAWLELIAENPAHEQHSPGLIHLFLLEEELLERGVDWIDVSADDDWMHLLSEPYEATAVDVLFSRRERALRFAETTAKKAGAWVLSQR